MFDYIMTGYLTKLTHLIALPRLIAAKFGGQQTRCFRRGRHRGSRIEQQNSRAPGKDIIHRSGHFMPGAPYDLGRRHRQRGMQSSFQRSVGRDQFLNPCSCRSVIAQFAELLGMRVATVNSQSASWQGRSSRQANVAA